MADIASNAPIHGAHPNDLSLDAEKAEKMSSPSTMSATSPRKEHHSTHSDLVRDFIIGFADGLTVPFALTAGLSSLGSSRLVILGGLAELFSGSISMGLGAYLASVTERKHYQVEQARELREVRESPAEEEEEIYDIFEKYGISREASSGVVEGLKVNEEMWVQVSPVQSIPTKPLTTTNTALEQFMMHHELRLASPPTRRHACLEGLVMGMAYIFGGLLPMIPYFCLHQVSKALFISIGITAVVLLVFGYVKAIVTGTGRRDAVMSALQTLLVGAVAAGVSYGIVRGVNRAEGIVV